MQDPSDEHRDAGAYEPSSAEEGEAATFYDSPALLKSDEYVLKRLTDMSTIVQELHPVIFYRSMNPWIERVYSYYLAGAYALDRWRPTNKFVTNSIFIAFVISFSLFLIITVSS